MKTTIQKWGNSLAVRIPKHLAEETTLGEGDEVALHAEEDRIVLERPRRRRYRLEGLLAGVTKGNRHCEINVGRSVGREA